MVRESRGTVSFLDNEMRLSLISAAANNSNLSKLVHELNIMRGIL